MERSLRWRAYASLAAVAGVILAFDQWSKYFVRTRLEVGETWAPAEWMLAYLRVVHWNNTGAAFGLLPSAGLVFTAVAILVSAAIIYYYPRVPTDQTAVRLALGLQLGGALGNLTDRLLMGTVTDFISVGTFPVFNVADASISVGTALLLASMWVDDRRRRRAAADAEPSAGDASES